MAATTPGAHAPTRKPALRLGLYNVCGFVGRRIPLDAARSLRRQAHNPSDAPIFSSFFGQRGADVEHVWLKQVKSAITFLKAFHVGREGWLEGIVYVDRPLSRPFIGFDASTTGEGAILWVLQAGPEWTGPEWMQLSWRAHA